MVKKLKLYKNFSVSKNHKNSILLIGNFDGLHIGHQKLFNFAKNYKKKHTNNILEKKNNLEAEFIAIVKKNIIDQRYLTEMQQDEKVR